MAVLFGGNGTDSLATMRYNIFSKKVVSASSFVSPERLPPTESATKLHFRSWSWQEKRRVWIPGTGPWNLKDNRLVPVMSTMNAAPDNLLKIIPGNCSTACQTLRCSCRRYVLPCTTVCGPCQIEECDNP